MPAHVAITGRRSSISGFAHFDGLAVGLRNRGQRRSYALQDMGCHEAGLNAEPTDLAGSDPKGRRAVHGPGGPGEWAPVGLL